MHVWETDYADSFLARKLLATPGWLSIDFESWPTDPAWHGEEAARAAPRGQQGTARAVARREAELAGRAHRRQPCVLALAHEGGRTALVQLEGGARQLRWLFAGRRAHLIAHNAQFEVEILLNHGVAVDIDCTLLAAKCLYLTAVDEERPQPVSFALADLVEREFGRTRDKSVRDRDWREPLDATAIEYALQDARDALALWQLYQARLEAEGLLPGYRLIARAIRPTASINLVGLLFDRSAHSTLVRALRADADQLEGELMTLCAGATLNHASMAQIGAWIMGEVLGDEGDEERVASFCARLQARCGVGWRRGKNGHLAITKALKPRMAVALELEFPVIARYLRTHATWTHATKLLGTFGEGLVSWLDADGRLRGQLKVGGTVTLRHSAVASEHPADATRGCVPGSVPRAAGSCPCRLRFLADRIAIGGDRRTG